MTQRWTFTMILTRGANYECQARRYCVGRLPFHQRKWINCVNLATIDRNCVLRTIGILPNPLLLKVVAALKIALELP